MKENQINYTNLISFKESIPYQICSLAELRIIIFFFKVNVVKQQKKSSINF